jgi:hypothetical protein
MEPTDSNIDGGQVYPLQYGTNEALLRSEIGFWREMIACSDDSQPPEYLERMQHALALAETRLLDLFTRYRDARATGGLRPDNVYYLSESGRHQDPDCTGSGNPQPAPE